MAKFALWWVRWNGSDYESRMTVGGRKATVEDFRERGFDRVVVLDGEGGGSHYTGPYYDSGRNDGKEFARWVLDNVHGIPVYITIPFKRPDGGQRDQALIPFKYSGVNSYYKGWIDGVLSVDNSDLTGFYWSYESCLQTGNYGKNVSKEFIQYMYNYIHDHGLELTWIPATNERGVSYLSDDAFDGILKVGGYFDYVFVQPNYYQNKNCIENINGTKQTFSYSYKKLVEKIRYIHDGLQKHVRKQNPNTVVSIEMEADRTILGIPCGYSGRCPENMGCDRNLKTCYENCREHEHEKAINYALDYMRALHDARWEPSDLAYYFSTNLKVMDALQERCRRELNEPYI
ncbi:DUF4855 domain-containing protein [Thermococcus sp. M36]|uniref:DUF4855 domain-containing protein n=1 Tax=Thermococcus sp. M36 TaxID=1638261 RepID=UPI003183D3C6